jgi:hypothetical protein
MLSIRVTRVKYDICEECKKENSEVYFGGFVMCRDYALNFIDELKSFLVVS